MQIYGTLGRESDCKCFYNCVAMLVTLGLYMPFSIRHAFFLWFICFFMVIKAILNFQISNTGHMQLDHNRSY